MFKEYVKNEGYVPNQMFNYNETDLFGKRCLGEHISQMKESLYRTISQWKTALLSCSVVMLAGTARSNLCSCTIERIQESWSRATSLRAVLMLCEYRTRKHRLPDSFSLNEYMRNFLLRWRHISRRKLSFRWFSLFRKILVITQWTPQFYDKYCSFKKLSLVFRDGNL